MKIKKPRKTKNNSSANRNHNHRKPKSATAEHYVDNDKLYEVLREFIIKYKEAEASGEELPKAPHFIGKSIISICERLATSYNFAAYTYRDEMVSDGILSCVKAIPNYDYEKYNKPFAYFTECAYWAYIQKINAEHKYTYTKHKNLGNMDMSLTGEMSDQEAHWNTIEMFEDKERRNKEKKIERDKELTKAKIKATKTIRTIETFEEE